MIVLYGEILIPYWAFADFGLVNPLLYVWYMYVCMCIGTFKCRCMWKPEAELGIVLHDSLLYLPSQGISVSPEFTHSVSLADQLVLEIPGDCS